MMLVGSNHVVGGIFRNKFVSCVRDLLLLQSAIGHSICMNGLSSLADYSNENHGMSGIKYKMKCRLENDQ